jgi:glutamine amidotransferase-like uncharacterized protein
MTPMQRNVMTEQMLKAAVKNIVYLYAGPGTSSICLDQTEHMLKHFLADRYHLQRIQPEEVIDGSWQIDAACFVMPGGQDSPYEEYLNPAGTFKIKSYVNAGGSYLGICAGAYFAAKKVEFALGSSIEINQKRSLNLYDGTASGPVLADYDYHSQKGARAAKVRCGRKSLSLYFNGGGTFLKTEKVPHLKVIGYYILPDKEKLPAIVHIKQDKECVILSGVHFEFEPSTMDTNDSNLSAVISAIQSTNLQRLALAKQLLSLLNLDAHY